jgi:hypothetical protein
MPKRLTIEPKDKRDLRRRYARGESAADLVVSRKDLGLTLAQIQNLICREGWAKMRGEIEQTRRRAANEVLAHVRADAGDELETILQSVKRGLKNDALQLEATGRFVETAADLSSAQRAKNLHLARTLKLFGIDHPDAQAGTQARLSLVFARYPDASTTLGGSSGDAVAVDVSATAVPDAEPGDDLRFDFDHDSEPKASD